MSGARLPLGMNVLDMAVSRMAELYLRGDRIVVSFSAGKDSGVILEVCLEAARFAKRLPVEVYMRDEEIMFPGTFEYAERTAAREEIDFQWAVANQPIINVFNRADPYWWVFDPSLDPSDWVRKPPDFAVYHPHLPEITSPLSVERYPPPEGHRLVIVTGLRVEESIKRLNGLHSSGGYVTKRPNGYGAWYARPIYDWTTGDVWKAIKEGGWDYNRAYDVMTRMGVPWKKQRIAPPTMTLHAVDALDFARRAWPQWFETVCDRLPGLRSAAMFGRRACTPQRRPEEGWEEVYHRTCIEEAPAWIAERATSLRDAAIRRHSRHAAAPLPSIRRCPQCMYSWKHMATNMFGGDPFSLTFPELPYVDPEFFRAGTGTWRGRPAW